MSWREQQPENWRTDPGSSAASGGHVAPEHATQPLFDSGDQAVGPAHSDSPARPRPENARTSGRRPARTDVIPRGEVQRERTDPGGRRSRRGGPAARRVRRTVRHVDPISVFKLSVFYYGCFVVLWLIFVAVAYWFVDSLGVFTAITDFLRSRQLRLLTKNQDLGLTLFFFEKWALLIGVTLAVIAVLVNTFLSFLYNLAADTVGGLEITFVEREL